MLRRADENWLIRILIDGACPLCKREARFLERLDDGRGLIQLEDLSAPEFDPTLYGLDQASVEARIHAVLPNGETIEGVEVFSRAYAAVGVIWVSTLAQWRGLRWLLDRLYLVFAKNRLRLTGRSPATCDSRTDDGTCSLDASDAAGTRP
jgi:predicted DCC family thiol-disulfide oxidoreductase YuxK